MEKWAIPILWTTIVVHDIPVLGLSRDQMMHTVNIKWSKVKIQSYDVTESPLSHAYCSYISITLDVYTSHYFRHYQEESISCVTASLWKIYPVYVFNYCILYKQLFSRKTWLHQNLTKLDIFIDEIFTTMLVNLNILSTIQFFIWHNFHKMLMLVKKQKLDPVKKPASYTFSYLLPP